MATKPKELPDAEKVLVVLPTETELSRLAFYFPSYNREHRTGILRGLFVEKSIDAILDQKFKVIGKDRALMTQGQLKGHKGWAHKRIKYTFVRLLYLRYLKDQGLSKNQARSKVHQDHVVGIFGHDMSRSNLNDITRSTKI